MRTGGGKGQFIQPLVAALEDAGYELARRSNSHFIYEAPGKQPITIPEKLNDRVLAKRLAKLAGASL